MTLNPEDYKLTPEQQLSYDKLQGSFYHFHRQYPSLSYYGNIPAQYSENTVSPIQWMHWIEGWIKTINDNQEKLNEDFNNFVDQFNKFLDDLPDYVVGLIKDKFDEERPGMITEITDGVEDKIKKDLTDPIQEEVNNITAQNDGMPKLFKILTAGDTFNEQSAPTAQFLVSPHLTRNAVMQNVMYDSQLGQWFISQSDSQSPEGFVVTRTDAGGNLLSQMWMKECDHGQATMLIPRKGLPPLIFFQIGGSYYRIPYTDNKTYTVDNAIKSFTPPINGNGGASYVDGVMTHINNQSSERILSVYPATFDEESNQFSFNGGTGDAIDLTGKVGTDDRPFQGITIIKKSDITGTIDNDNYIIFVGVGKTNTLFDMYTFNYSLSKNELTEITTISNLYDVVKPTLADDLVGWRGDFEPEGITRITINGGGRQDGYVSTLAFGLSTGEYLKRQHYVFGFTNPLVASYLTTARNSFYERGAISYVPNDVTELWRVDDVGEYELPTYQVSTFTDFPSNWRGIVDTNPWKLIVSKPDQNGDFMQTLKRRGYGSAVEIYERGINYTSGGDRYGDNYLPTAIGSWYVIQTDGQQAKTKVSTMSSKTTLFDFCTPGISYYLSGAMTAKLTNLMGADKYISGKAFRITTTSWSADQTRILVKIEYLDSITPASMATIMKTIPVTKDTYGPGFIFDSSVTTTDWSYVKGTNLS